MPLAPLGLLTSQVHARLRVSVERDGAYLAIESLSLAVEKIAIKSMSDHSRRWGFLLGTVTTLQWLLSGFLERKLLGLISQAVVAQNQHQRLVAWEEIPVLQEVEASMARWEATAARREVRESRSVRTIQAAWRQLLRRRERLAARLLQIRLGFAEDAPLRDGNSISIAEQQDSYPSPSATAPGAYHRRMQSEILAMGTAGSPALFMG